MIISASRRTDIPAFHMPWLMERLEAGHVTVSNPYNPKQSRLISLQPEAVDCLVFWTKNPQPMLPYLNQLTRMEYAYYFQFSLLPYDLTIAPHLPDQAALVRTFRTLSAEVGPQYALWRYDPVFLDEIRTIPWHFARFYELCRALNEATKICTISFLDRYGGLDKRFQTPTEAEMHMLADGFARIAALFNISLQTCAETIDLSAYGIHHGACIDKALIETRSGKTLSVKKDKGQRPACLCAQSVDIGTYGTCAHGCRYCYGTSFRAFNSKRM